MNTIEETIDNLLQQQDNQTLAQKQTLRNSVQESLQNYFTKLGDTLTDNLYEMFLTEVEKPLLDTVMEYTRGNQSKAAKMLGLSRGTLRKKLKIYGLL